MHELREQQFDFAMALTGDATAFVSQAAAGTRISPAAAVGVYRNNHVQGFAKALALTFPVLEQLVGAPYFRQMSGQFQARHPSRSGNLSGIGAPLANYLQEEFAGTSYEYLSDIARLEWLVQEVQTAAAAPRLTADAFRAVSPDAYAQIRLRWHPAAGLLESAFPVLRIWQSNQAGAEPDLIDLRSGSERLLIYRNRDGLQFRLLEPGCFELATALAAGVNLGGAFAVASETAGPFDLAQALHRLLEAGSFTQLLE